jgi:hypothetical protein
MRQIARQRTEKCLLGNKKNVVKWEKANCPMEYG